jgi:mRNA-degrading endonuclease RelE of RelBE toxin-antitoxin system
LPRLDFKREAEDQLAALPSNVKDDIDLALLRIQANPEEEGRPLGTELAGKWRKRVGGYRIIYRVLDGGALVIVDAILRRKVAYRRKRRR